MSILVIAEHDNTSIKEATLATVTAAKQLGDVTVLIAGKNCAMASEAAAKIHGVARVLVADDDAYNHQLAENMTQLVISVASHYSHLFAPATSMGKNFMPRVAALLDVAQISDIVKIVSADTFVRPIHAGNAMATVQIYDEKKVITVRTTAFDPAPATGGSAVIDIIDPTGNTGQSVFMGEELSVSDRPELTSAKTIISGGRGMANGENFVMLEKIANKLGAAIGASRAAVDAGFVANDLQVGQTGKIVAPELYIAVGISGAIQHLAGMKDSKVIVAINKDEEAPIFQVADYGLVADLFEAIPALENELN